MSEERKVVWLGARSTGDWAFISLPLSLLTALPWSDFFSSSISNLEGAYLLGSSKMFPIMGCRTHFPMAPFSAWWLVCWNCILKEVVGWPEKWAAMSNIVCMRKCILESSESTYIQTFGYASFPLVGDCHCTISCSGFNSLLICKWTVSHFFVEGSEPEVFPSEVMHSSIKMNFIHPTNMVVYFKCIYRVLGTCWAL